MRPQSNNLHIADSLNSDSGRISKLIERSNNRLRMLEASDIDNYINRNIKFLFEYSMSSDFSFSSLGVGHRLNFPSYIPVAIAEAAITNTGWEIWNFSPDDVAGYPCIVASWDKELMFISDIKVMDSTERMIPTIFTIGLQISKGLDKRLRDPAWESRYDGFLKSFFSFNNGELDISFLPFGFCKSISRIPISMIKRCPEIVNNVTNDDGGFIRYGFISFSKSGSFSSFCICFENVRERAIFAEHVIKLNDMFRGPINFQ